uniref:Uncharacterized protein n=1 Tax=Arion vulgaris TaxID=1028688 RepID=A0A0B7AC93_9EUPU
MYLYSCFLVKMNIQQRYLYQAAVSQIMLTGMIYITNTTKTVLLFQVMVSKNGLLITVLTGREEGEGMSKEFISLCVKQVLCVNIFITNHCKVGH